MARMKSLWAVVLGCALIGSFATRAEAQEVDTSIEVQLFDYAIGPKTFSAVNDGRILTPKQFALDLMVTFLTDPYTVYNVTNDDEIIDTRTSVVGSLVAGQLNAAYGLHRRFHLGIALPIIFSMDGDGLDPATAMPTGTGYNVAGIGDLKVELKAKLYDKNSIQLAAAPAVTIPSSVGGNDGDFMGDDLPSFRGYLAAQWTNRDGKLSAGGNVGFIGRKSRTVYASEVASQLTYGAAAAFRPAERVALIGEFFGRSGLTNFGATDSSPSELSGVARFRVTQAIDVAAGAGFGLVQAIGAPQFRFFASLGWSPDFGDTDNDGIGNTKDKCPLIPEDKDGFEDSDGCPDNDNDGDLRDDSEDKCPDKAEDKDGFEDEDGCPEPDNDGDGILDVKDRCPNDKEDGAKPFPKDGCPGTKSDIDMDGIPDAADKCYEDPEDFDGFDDGDGCPDNDNDGDGIEDVDDECPLCAEDKDGFEDENGCPELDNDGDGVVDSMDKCPDEAETINGYQDGDGCPDSGRTAVALDGDRLVYRGKITFSGPRVRSGGRKILDQAAELMKAQGLVNKWRIVVAASGSGGETQQKIKAQARAQGVKQQLVNKGVPEERIEAIGVASDRELVAISVIDRAKAYVEAGDFCPAELSAKETAPAVIEDDSANTSEPETSEPEGEGAAQ